MRARITHPIGSNREAKGEAAKQIIGRQLMGG
jgi:hypothetical protein